MTDLLFDEPDAFLLESLGGGAHSLIDRVEVLHDGRVEHLVDRGTGRMRPWSLVTYEWKDDETLVRIL